MRVARVTVPGGAIPRRFALVVSALVLLSGAAGWGLQPAPAATLGSTGVLGWSPGIARNVPLTIPLTVYFNRAMDPGAVQRAWKISPAVAGRFAWHGASVSFRPARPLRAGSIYRLSIDTTARSTTGIPLSTPFAVQFSTGDALRVTTYSPWNGTRGVPASGLISITFNHPMVPLAGLSVPPAHPRGWSISITPRLAGHGSWLGTSTWVFHPVSTLQPSTHYTVSLGPGAQDAWGQPLGRTLRWSFSTLTPEVVSRSPHNGALYVDPRTAIAVTFNQPMAHAATAAAFSVSVGGARVPGRVGWHGTQLTFQPAALLSSDRSYVVRLAPTARSANRTATLGKAVQWQFRSSPLPKVTGTDPGQQKTAYAWSSTRGYGPVCCYAYSVQLTFNAPMDKSSLDKHLTISPSVARFSTEFGGPDQNGTFTYNIAGDFKPSASYTIALAPGAQDRYGRPLPGGFTFPFTTSRLYPSVSLYGMPGAQGIAFSAGQIKQAPVQCVNIPRVTYTLIRTNLYGLSSIGGGLPSGQTIRRWTETVSNPLNVVQNRSVQLAQGNGSPLPPGLYWLDATAPDKVPGWPAFTYPPETGELVVVSNVSLTVKRGDNGVLAWLNSAQTGKPLAGVPVRLTDYQGVTLTSGSTDVRGLHLFPNFGNSGRLYAAVVADGTHYTMSTLNWQPNLTSPGYLPDFWGAYWGGQVSRGTYLYTDRPVYRPGQRVHFRGVLWRDQDGVYSLLGRKRAAVKVVDPLGHVVYRTSLTLDRFGAVHGSFTLPGNASTGLDFVFVNIPQSVGISANFTVAEYRKPEFLTAVAAAKPSYVQGQTAAVTATVKYVFGSPVIDQKVSWVAYVQPQYPRPSGWDDYSFLDWEDLWQQNVNPSSGQSQFGQQMASGTGTTDARGRLMVQLPVKAVDRHFDQVVTLEATATDVNYQSVSGRVSLPEYRADVIAGLAAEHQTQPVGQPQTIDVVAVRHDGAAVPNQTLTATVYRRTYSSKLVETSGHTTDWQAVPHDESVETHTLTTDSKGRATLSFTPHQGGEYYIVVQGKDELGNSTRNAISVYASAAGFTDWGLSSDTSVNLKPDRSTYTVGQTAHITVPSPFDNATALITVERGRIRSERVEHLASNSSTIDIPITLDDLPNVYVTVTLYRGWRSGSPPDWRYGTAELHVKVDTKHLVVHLTQNGFRHHPGDTVMYAVTTTDARGRPVSAQLSVALVDTSVLALQDENNPDILKALYSERPLGVFTASDGVLSIDHLTEQPNFQLAPSGTVHGGPSFGPWAPAGSVPATGGGGGGGGGAPITVRSRFADTAYWAGGVTTDASGHGTVRIKLPDNATTWRLDARGITTGQVVGQDDLRTLATQDLVLRPVLPRFLIQGDHLQVGTVLNNNLNRPVSARVTMTAHGLQLPSGRSRTIDLPAHGEGLLMWTAGVPQGSAATVLVRADSRTAGVRGDAVRTQVPVHPPLTDETVATSGQVYGSTQQVVIVPRNAAAVPGALTVQVSSSLTAGLGAAYGEFKASPTESNDDVADRLLVAAALRTLPQPVTGLSAGTYHGLGLTVALAVQKLLDRQFYDGGWPWFTSPFVYQSDPAITADALQALAASGEHGAQVRQSVGRARAFLQRQLSVVPAAERAHLLLVLAASGPAPRAQAETLYADSIRRSHFDAAPLADLGMSLSMAHDGTKARSIVSTLDGTAKVSATGAHWESSGWTMWTGPVVESTSEVLSTLLALSPHDPFVPAGVRWLMLARQGDGWDCTHDTAQAIAALAAYARAAREGTADYRYRVLLNGGTKISGAYTTANVSRISAFKVPVSHLLRPSPNRLVLGRVPQSGTFGPGPLYYLARLHYYLRADAIPARSEGVSVRRRYLDLSGHPISRVAAGSPVRVELTIHTDQSLMYMNVQDPLPPGLEPIDDSLNVSQQGLFGPSSYWLPFGPTSDLSAFLMHTDLHDNRVSLYSYYLPPGTFRYTYLAQATVPGRYAVPPTRVAETFFPEVFGRSAGQVLTIS